MPFEMSAVPQSILYYLVPSGGLITSPFVHRQDKILNAVSFDATVSTLFNDFVSCYSPLSDKVGDEYYLMTSRERNSFLIGTN